MKWKEWIPYIVCLLVVLLIKQFIVTPVRVDGSSMVPTLRDKDFMLLDKISYRFQDIERFDIVVIHRPDKDIIKRVIGLPGEVVSFQDNKLYIDGKEVDQPFSYAKTKDFSLSSLQVEVIPEGYYFVVGDNRIDSKDSRDKRVGLIEKKFIQGKASFTLFPFSRFGSKK